MTAVCKQLEAIISEEDDEDRGCIMAKDFTHEFYKEPYPTKNIRVKPTAEGGEDERDGQNRYNADGDMKKDDDQVYNVEMAQVRSAVKKRNAEFKKRKAEDEEKQKRKRR